MDGMQDAQWWYANSKQSEGPVDLAGLRRLQQDGTVTARTLMWREGMASWRPLAELDPSVAPMDPIPPSIEPVQAVSASGASTADPSDPYRAPAASPVAATAPQLEGDIALYAAVVGGNFPIYRQRWRLDQGIADGNGTWHWPAFLIGVIWMVYRRMYRLAAIWAGVLVFFSIAEALLGVPKACRRSSPSSSTSPPQCMPTAGTWRIASVRSPARARWWEMTRRACAASWPDGVTPMHWQRRWWPSPSLR
jgi:hypothetical protein